MARTDIHRPSTIVPQDYEYVAQECARPEIGSAAFILSERDRIQAHMAKTNGTYSQHEHGGNCHVCDSVNAIYTVLFYHAITNSYVRMGTDCADKACGYDSSAFRKRCSDWLEAYAGKNKAQAVLSQAGLTEAWSVYIANSTERLPWEEITIRDIVGKLVKYGSLSDKQIAFVAKLLLAITNRATVASRTQERETAAKAPKAPTGKMIVRGEVLSTRMQEGFYGTQYKMLVKHSTGWKVWSTVPAALGTVERGQIVTFSAVLEPSSDDDTFAFAKRPCVNKACNEALVTIV